MHKPFPGAAGRTALPQSTVCKGQVLGCSCQDERLLIDVADSPKGKSVVRMRSSKASGSLCCGSVGVLWPKAKMCSGHKQSLALCLQTGD